MQKNRACDDLKVVSKAEVIRLAKWEGKNVHLAALMDLCHPKNPALDKKSDIYKD